MMSQLVRSGKASPRMKPLVSGEYSSRRWMVLASRPQASASRRAARPVGAASVGLTPRWTSATSSERSSVVLPVPGPPVITVTLLCSAHRSAARCSADNSIPPALAAASIALLDHRPAHRAPPSQPLHPLGDRGFGVVQAASGKSRDCRRRRGPSATTSPVSTSSSTARAASSGSISSAARELMLEVTEGREDVALVGHPFEQVERPRHARAESSLCGMPSFSATVSAVRKPMPAMVRAST